MRFIEIVPLLTIVLMAALLAILIWIVDRRERTDQAETLVRDALWVEQSLRFQITSAEEAAERLALDIASGTIPRSEYANHFNTFIASHPEIWFVKVTDSTGRTLERSPASAIDLWLDETQMAQLDRARGTGRSRYGTPRRASSGHVADMIVSLGETAYPSPLSNGGLVIAFDFNRLLIHHVPWWITQSNTVRLEDAAGIVLAQKSTVSSEPESDQHTISLDPPLPGVRITLTRRAQATSLASNSLIGAVVALSVVAVLSTLALQRHWRRRLQAETSLREAHAFRKAMEESLTIGMRARDVEGRILYVNPAFCRMVGLSPEDLVGRAPPMPYWVPELIEETLARQETLGQEAPEGKSFETRFRHCPDGRMFDVLVYEAPLIDADGQHRGWMGSIIDITERKAAAAKERLQAESIQRMGRLTAMGEMASTIAHELNQPLAAISSYAAGALNRIRAHDLNGPDLQAALEKLDDQAQRAGRVIRRVHDFVRKREPKFGPVALGPVVQDLAAFLAASAAKAGASIRDSIDADLPPVAADRILIEQVILNLARNGIEAMAATAPGNRVLDIAVRRSGTGGDVIIEVADRGPGIDPDLAQRLFQPFVSTKADGMGMGLSICRTIIEQHQGRLEHLPRPGGGTVFVVTLPATPGREQAA